MSKGQSDLSLGQALKELERLMVVWDDLRRTRGGSPFIKDLVGKRIGEMKLRYKYAKHVISLDNLRSLLQIHKRIESIGNTEAVDKFGVVDFIADKLIQKSKSQRLESDVLRKSTLELFEDLEFWSVLNTLFEGTFALDKASTDAIAKTISRNVDACPSSIVANPGSLEVVEIGAKLMRALPSQHHSKILQVVNSHIMGLTMADVHTSAKPAVVDIGDDGVAKVGERASREPTAAKNTHAKVTADFQTETRRLQEQANQYQVTISEMNQDKELYTQEKPRLEGQVHDLNQKSRHSQSSNFDLEQKNLALHSEVAELKSKNAAFEKRIGLSKSNHQNKIRKLKEEVAILGETLSDQNYAPDTDDKIYDGSFRGRAEKLAEVLAEAEEDKAVLTRDNARLAVEKASVEESLAESEDSKIAMSNEIHGLGTENDRLEQELKDASDSLEEAEDDRATLSRNVEKLTSEKACLEKELAGAQDDRAMLSQNVEELVFEKGNLEGELASAQDERAMLSQNFEELLFEKADLEGELASAQDDRAMLSWKVEGLVFEKADLEGELASAQDDRAMLSWKVEGLVFEKADLEGELASAQDDRAMLSWKVEELVFEKGNLEIDLAGAQDILRQISSFSSSIRPIATDSPSQHADAEANADTDTATSSTGVLTPPSSTQTTP